MLILKSKPAQSETDITNAETALKQALVDLHCDTSPFLIPYYYNYASMLIYKLNESEQLFTPEVVNTIDKISEHMVLDKEEEKESVLQSEYNLQKIEQPKNQAGDEAEDNDEEIIWQHLEAARVIAETEIGKASAESNEFKSFQEWLALIHEKEGELYYCNDNYQFALNELKKSEELREKLGNSLEQAKVSYTIGFYLSEFDNKEEAIKNCQKSIALTLQWLSKRRGIQIENANSIQFQPEEEEANKIIQKAYQLIDDINTDLKEKDEIVKISKAEESDKFGERKLNGEITDLGLLSKNHNSNV